MGAANRALRRFYLRAVAVRLIVICRSLHDEPIRPDGIVFLSIANRHKRLLAMRRTALKNPSLRASRLAFGMALSSTEIALSAVARTVAGNYRRCGEKLRSG